jgi:hypothetical protein
MNKGLINSVLYLLTNLTKLKFFIMKNNFVSGFLFFFIQKIRGNLSRDHRYR